MIDLLRKIKEVSEIECRIGEYSDELIDCMPVILLTPISEKWEFNQLGNPSNKNIKFGIEYYEYHVENGYDIELKKAVEEIKKLLKHPKVKKDILTYVGVEIKPQLLEENTVINMAAEINLKLVRR